MLCPALPGSSLNMFCKDFFSSLYVYVCRQDEDEIGCSLARWRAAAESQHKIHLWDQEEEEPDGVRPRPSAVAAAYGRSVRWDQKDERAKEQDHNTTKAIQEKDTRRDNHDETL